MLDALLIEVLVDPQDKLPLWYFEDEDVLYNPRLRRSYAIKNDIPVLLIDEATEVSDQDAERFEKKAKTSLVETGTPSSTP